MDELGKEKNKLKAEAKKVKQERNTKKEIQQNYEMGIKYYKDIEKTTDYYELNILVENKKDFN